MFDGLDKITGRIISFEVAINETVQFGTLQITPRVCYSRPPTEQPQTDVFAQVDEIDEKKEVKRIFSGWMFADSPGLHGVEHPDLRCLADRLQRRNNGNPRRAPGEASARHGHPADEATDANGQPSSPMQAPAAPKNRKPRAAPTVVAAPRPRPPTITRRSNSAARSSNSRGR